MSKWTCWPRFTLGSSAYPSMRGPVPSIGLAIIQFVVPGFRFSQVTGLSVRVHRPCACTGIVTALVQTASTAVSCVENRLRLRMGLAICLGKCIRGSDREVNLRCVDDFSTRAVNASKGGIGLLSRQVVATFGTQNLVNATLGRFV